MSKTTLAGSTMLPLLVVAVLTGCAHTRIAFEKPGVTAADRQRDQNQCLSGAMVSEGGSILTPTVDRDALIQCMRARGYSAGWVLGDMRALPMGVMA